MVRYVGILGKILAAATVLSSCWLTVCPLASAFVAPQTSIITPRRPSPDIKSATFTERVAAVGASQPTISMLLNRSPSSAFATTSGFRLPFCAARAFPVGGCASSRKPAANISTGKLGMTETEAEVAGDRTGVAGDTATAIIAGDFDAKKDLMNQVDLASSSKKRTEVNELMLKMEPMNPTESPARSPILNGVWEFLYVGGTSPGTLAVQVLSRLAKNLSGVFDLKTVTLTIKRDQPRVEAAVKASIFGSETQVKVRTRLEVRSDMRLQEVYEEAEIAGLKLPIPARIQPRRNLFITYLDDDIVIARDDSGAPDLLIRKSKDFPFNTGTPSTSEDDASPGSG